MIETPKVSDASMVYMYGLSDFWIDLFGDREVVEQILESTTIQLSEVYSYFLQRTSGISIADIQERYDTRIELLLLNEKDLADPTELTTFKIDESLWSAKRLMNRPLLPTETLVNGVDYEIDTEEHTLRFNKPIGHYKFPRRKTSEGEWQYAIWMSDVKINERWIDNTFGRIVGFTEEDALFNYKSFLQGVYYLRSNGPNIDHIERGVNLAMGMPYARAQEVILDISQDPVTTNWLVFTPTYAYEVPYGYYPDRKVGEVLNEGELISTWVEVKDHKRNGAWWYDIYIPQAVLENTQNTLDIGVAEKGSTGDMMMENFLKHHMFEVLLTLPSSNEDAFYTAQRLVLHSKPSHTYPVFVWKVQLEDDRMDINDLDFKYTLNAEQIDTCMAAPSIEFMRRDTDDPNGADYNPRFTRGIHWYNRSQVSYRIAELAGYGEWKGNGGWLAPYQDIADDLKERLGYTLRGRGDLVSARNRSDIIRGWRNEAEVLPDPKQWTVPEECVLTGTGSLDFDARSMVHLHLLTEQELQTKVTAIQRGFNLVGKGHVAFKGMNLYAEYFNMVLRDDTITPNALEDFDIQYSTRELDPKFSRFAYQMYLPKRSIMPTSGNLFFARVNRTVWAAYWVPETNVKVPTAMPVEDPDRLDIVEDYDYSLVGQNLTYYGTDFPAGQFLIEPPEELSSKGQVIITVGDSYVPESGYEINPNDDISVVLNEVPTERGYCTWIETSTLNTTEEILATSQSVHTLTETPAYDDILVYVDGKWQFGYSLNFQELTLETAPVTEGFVRYIDGLGTDNLGNSGTEFALTQTADLMVFIDGVLQPEYTYKVDGLTLKLANSATGNVVVRYLVKPSRLIQSLMTRSTVIKNNAKFLMDRSRPTAEYTDHEGTTSYFDRSGIYGAENLLIRRRI